MVVAVRWKQSRRLFKSLPTDSVDCASAPDRDHQEIFSSVPMTSNAKNVIFAA